MPVYKKAKLKYFFIAEFVDGFVYKQNQKDTSIYFPLTKNEKGEIQGKNCYADVLEEIRTGRTLRFFSLLGEGRQISVDLGTGLFEINGFALKLESERLPRLPEKFELVFYHQVDQKVDVTYDLTTGKATDINPQDEDFREYFIGWQCTIDGKNYQQKLAVA
jgi:hypothetical protein